MSQKGFVIVCGVCKRKVKRGNTWVIVDQPRFLAIASQFAVAHGKCDTCIIQKSEEVDAWIAELAARRKVEREAEKKKNES